MATQFHATIAASGLPPNSSAAVEIAGISVLICNIDGEFHAIRNICPHQLSPLTAGRIRRGALACPLHGLRFDLKSGKPLGELTRNCLIKYPVRIRDGMIEIALS